MHIRHALALAAGGLLLTAVAPISTAHADDNPNRLTIDPIGSVSEDGTITLSGSYRCVGDRTPGPVYLGANIISDDLGSGVGGAQAVCDGRTHRWRNQAQPALASYEPGRVTVEGTLMKLRNERGLPTPHVLAVRDQEVNLLPERH